MQFKVLTWKTLDFIVQVAGGVICLVWHDVNIQVFIERMDNTKLNFIKWR